MINLETESRLEKIIHRMRERGHRLTPQRVAILNVLIGNKEHPDAEQIYEQVKVDFPMTSLATVYKTVAVLKEMGEVLELGYSDGSNRYDGENPHPHPHMICVKCKGMIDVDVCEMDEICRSVIKKTGYTMINTQFDFFGVCPQCQENR